MHTAELNIKILNLSLLLLRLGVGLVLFVAGAGKIFGWFGGFGAETTIQYYVSMGIPVSLAYISMYTEFIGGILLIVGLFTRIAALLILINMLVASFVTWPAGFLAGSAFPILLAVNAAVVMLVGPMRYSLDYFRRQVAMDK